MGDAIILGFGGCQLHGPLNTLPSREPVALVNKMMGFEYSPFVFTPRASLQLLEFCRGKLSIPPIIRRLCWYDSAYEPDHGKTGIADQADIVLIEPNTPVDIVYRGFSLSQQEVKRHIENEAETRYPPLAKVVRRWKRDGLYKGNEKARRAAAEEILKVFVPASEEDELLVDVVREAKGEVAGADDVRRGIAEVRDAVSGRLAIVLYTMQFMPDGRAISWPADFKDNVTAAAKSLDLPIYEPAQLIAKRGVETALTDFRHYRNDFKFIAGTEMMAFIARVKAGARFAPIEEQRLTAEQVTPQIEVPRPVEVPRQADEKPWNPADFAADRVRARRERAAADLDAAREHLRRRDGAAALAATEDLLTGRTRLAAQKIRAPAYLRLGRLGEAELAYRELLQSSPEDPRSYDNLAKVMMQSGRFDDAIELLNRAVELAPDAAIWRHQLALAFFSADRINEALRAVEDGLGLEPGEYRLRQLRQRIADYVKAA